MAFCTDESVVKIGTKPRDVLGIGDGWKALVASPASFHSCHIDSI